MKTSNFYTNTTITYGIDMRIHLLSALRTLIFNLLFNNMKTEFYHFRARLH